MSSIILSRTALKSVIALMGLSAYLFGRHIPRCSQNPLSALHSGNVSDGFNRHDFGVL
jgi:hypothetical protein